MICQYKQILKITLSASWVILIGLLLFLSFSKASLAKNICQPGQTKVIEGFLDDAHFFSLLNLDYPGMEDVKRFVLQGKYVNAKFSYLDFRRNRNKSKWHIDPFNIPKIASSVTYPSGERIIQHYIKTSSYGGKEYFLGNDINWDFNPKALTDPDYDPEFSNTLHRLYFWNDLGQAYWATLDEKYSKEWVSQLCDWVKDNPVDINSGPYDRTPWRSLEVGIRMSNTGSWMNAYNYFLFSSVFTPDIHSVFVNTVIDHGERLKKITVTYPQRNTNWVIKECNGLATIGILFPELKESADYIKIALDRLNKELDNEVYPDGFQFELSPMYHLITIVDYMDIFQLAHINNIPLPGNYLAKLKKMYECNLYLMDPSGHLPPFNDAGRSSTSNTLHDAYKIWGDKKFLFGATLGKEGEKPDFNSYYFNYAGYYVMREGWNYNANCLYFDAGPVGYAHQHEDKLNLFLYSRGKILLTEPGIYHYDQSEWRRYSLSTSAHNTILVDGKEQHRTDIPECVRIKEPLKNPWLTSPLFDYGSGIYSSGYQECKHLLKVYMPKKFVGEKDSSIIHTRHVIFLKPYYYVAVDFLEGRGKHKYEAYFHLNAPDAKTVKNSLTVHTVCPDSIQLGLFPMDVENLKMKIVKGQENPILGWTWLSGEKMPIPTVVYSKEEEAPATFSTLLYPYYLNEPQVSYSKILTNVKNVWGVNISTPNEDISLAINKDHKKSNVSINSTVISYFSTNAKVSVLRKPKGETGKYLGFYDFSEYRDKSLSFSTSKSVSLTIIKKQDKVLIFNPQENDIHCGFIIPLKKKITIPPKKWVSVTSFGMTELDDSIILFGNSNQF